MYIFITSTTFDTFRHLFHQDMSSEYLLPLVDRLFCESPPCRLRAPQQARSFNPDSFVSLGNFEISSTTITYSTKMA